MRNARLQTMCAAGGLVAPPVALVALFGSSIMPPRHANDSAVQIAAFYSHHSDLKMAGAIVAFLAIGLLGPLVAVITLQLLRIEGRHPVMAFLQMIAGTVTWAFLSIPLLILFVAAYRPGRDPELTQTLHDLGWILFLIPIAPFVVQNVATAIAILSDDGSASGGGSARVYPRWVAFANLLIAASFLPDVLLGFFRIGPFSYQGLASFWIPTVTYGLWLNIMGFTTLRAVQQEARLERALPDAGPAPAPAPVLAGG